ncbi:MAG: hypothetical protein Q9182_001125 [Xanthomendoza sp. 2 TL-2023]
MVVIIPPPVQSINAYSLSPLTAAMNGTIQHGFYDGTYARYGDPIVSFTVHDRPEFHGISHYELRITLDSEGSLDPFLIIDDRTPELDAVWYVQSTEFDQTLPVEPGQVVEYPHENFTLWQAHMQVADVPISAVSWDNGCGDLAETVWSAYHPYDPHDPQDQIISMGINWTDPSTQSGFWGPANIKANLSELEWSAETRILQSWLPPPPVVARLNAAAAKQSGFFQKWTWQPRLAPAGAEVELGGYYDWTSPRWPTGYPDEARSTVERADVGASKLTPREKVERVNRPWQTGFSKSSLFSFQIEAPWKTCPTGEASYYSSKKE